MKAIYCVDELGGFSKDGRIPWHCKADLAHFKEITTASEKTLLIMGRKTYESMSDVHHRVFVGSRHACVLSGDQRSSDNPNVTWFTSIDRARFFARDFQETFVIGGKELLCEMLQFCDYVYETRLDKSYNCDIFMPSTLPVCMDIPDKCPPQWVEISVDVKKECTIRCYKNTEMNGDDEGKYLWLMRRCLLEGVFKNDRTEVGRLSVFGANLTFDLDRFPLLTTKKVYWKSVCEELLWFLRGETHSKGLEAQGVNIWKGNSSREALDRLGFADREEGDNGPIYGFQWRHFGAEYARADTDYTGKGVDQIEYVVSTLKKDPTSARALMSAWNPMDLNKMSLPPCHVSYQFSLHDGQLCCHMYQRSADVFLGLPFNIASSALLCNILANILGTPTGKLHIAIGDAHVYANHTEQCFEQLERDPFKFPTLQIEKQITLDNLSSLKFSDFSLVNYNHHDPIRAPMAV